MSSAGLGEALRGLRKRTGTPSEEDRPPVTVPAGTKVKVLDGQLNLDGRAYDEKRRIHVEVPGGDAA